MSCPSPLLRGAGVTSSLLPGTACPLSIWCFSLQDLEYLSEGLEGRSHSPVALLFDSLQRPDTDFGGTAESVLSWWHEPDRAIPHLVLGRNAPGGAWHVSELEPAGVCVFVMAKRADWREKSSSKIPVSCVTSYI